MRTNQSGFTLTHVLLAILLVGAIGLAGYYVWKQQNKEEKTTDAAITSFEECVAAGNPVMESFPERCAADGKTFTKEYNLGKLTDECALESDVSGQIYTHPSESYKLCAPDGWTLHVVAGEDAETTAVISSDAYLNVKAGTSPKLVYVGGKDGADTFSIFQQNIDEDYEWMTAGFKKVSTLETVQGLATVYTYTEAKEDNEENAAIDKLPKGTVSTTYLFESESRVINLTYNHFPGQDDRSALVRSVVKSIAVN